MKTGVKYSVIGLFCLFCYIATEAEFRCDYKYSPVAKGWFKHYVIPATWGEARIRCTLQGAKLASPLNFDIETEMINIIRNFITSGTEIFTGLSANISRGNFYSIEGVPLAEIGSPWAVNEPNNVGNNENCITFNAYGEIADRSCDEPRPYICFRSGKVETEANECGTIDSEYQWDRRSNSCYKLHTVSRTFADAHFACSAEGGHLAIIKSDVEATVLKELYAKYPPEKIVGPYDKNYIMVGFHSWADSSDWRTIHGETLKEAGYSKFAPGEPNNASTGEFCGSISRGGLLNDLRCEIPTPFICEKKPDYPPVCSQSKNQYNFREKS